MFIRAIGHNLPPVRQASSACSIFGRIAGPPECLPWTAQETHSGITNPKRTRTETEELNPLALTGGIACGKTTAGHFLLEAGFSHVYDTDAICHDLYEKPTPDLIAGMRKNWGDDVVPPDRRIDRAALSKRLFAASDRAAAFASLNALVHPAVEQRLHELMVRDAVGENELVLVEVPLLFEIGWETKYSHTIAVWMPREMQIERLMARNGLTREDAESRLDVQMSADAKLTRADFGLINNGGLDHLRKQCFELAAHLRSTLFSSK